MKQNYHAIALDKKDTGEMDRLYTFYTRENGLIRVPARSIRKSEAKLAAQVEDFVLAHITVVKNYGRGTLAGAVAEEYFDGLHMHYVALSCVDHVRKVFLTVVQEQERDEQIFGLLLAYLRKIEELSDIKDHEQNDEQIKWITYAFLIKLFGIQGYVFDVKKCVACEVLPTAHTRTVFDVHSGGMICGHCAQKTINVCAMDVDTIKSLRAIYNNHLSMLSKIVVHQTVNQQLQSIVTQIEKWIMR